MRGIDFLVDYWPELLLIVGQLAILAALPTVASLDCASAGGYTFTIFRF